jgi:hypothetical protein
MFSLLFLFKIGITLSQAVYHNINTHQRHDLHLPQAIYQKGVYYLGIFNP